MSKKDIGIDLGTANTLIYHKSRGIVLNEPSVVAVDERTEEILAVGCEAKYMLGRTPSNIRAVRPLSGGVIADYESAGAMLGHFLKKVFKKNSGLKPSAVICVPTGITAVERRAVEETASIAGIRSCKLMYEPMAAAIGAGLPVEDASGTMIVNIGGGTSEVAVISLGGIVAWKTVRTAGDELDSAIISFIRKKYGISAGPLMAENVKINIGTALKGDKMITRQICGRSFANGMPRSVYISAEDVRTALMPLIFSIIDAIKSTLEITPPELSADILRSGIVLTGGGAMINGIDRLICHSTGMPVRIADSPIECVASGAGYYIENKTKELIF